MPAPEVELWAACAPCNRSFFVPAHARGIPDAVLCPVCAEMPSHIEERAGDGAGVRALAPESLG